MCGEHVPKCCCRMIMQLRRADARGQALQGGDGGQAWAGQASGHCAACAPKQAAAPGHTNTYNQRGHAQGGAAHNAPSCNLTR